LCSSRPRSRATEGCKLAFDGLGLRSHFQSTCRSSICDCPAQPAVPPSRGFRAARGGTNARDAPKLLRVHTKSRYAEDIGPVLLTVRWVASCPAHVHLLGWPVKLSRLWDIPNLGPWFHELNLVVVVTSCKIHTPMRRVCGLVDGAGRLLLHCTVVWAARDGSPSLQKPPSHAASLAVGCMSGIDFRPAVWRLTADCLSYTHPN
jgi:hypothetical protein